jgi:hypothetical protein
LKIIQIGEEKIKVAVDINQSGIKIQHAISQIVGTRTKLVYDTFNIIEDAAKIAEVAHKVSQDAIQFTTNVGNTGQGFLEGVGGVSNVGQDSRCGVRRVYLD